MARPRRSRLSRFYVKKRGERSTGSPRAGSAGLAAFFGGLCAVGIVFFVITFTTLAWPEWKANQQFDHATCTIIRSAIVAGADETGCRPIFQVTYKTADGWEYTPSDWINWDISGTYFRDKAECDAIRNRFPVGSECDCWYDRSDLNRVVLIRGYSGYVWLILLLPGVFILVGGGGIGYLAFSRTMSAERRKDLARRAAAIAPRNSDLLAELYPGVPHDTSLTNSPGIRLAYRLPLLRRGGWSLAALATGSALFGGLVAFVLALAVLKAWDGQWDWPLMVAVFLFAPLAAWLLYVCVKRVTQSVLLGHTVVEISRQPLYPGAECQVYVTQLGRLAIRRMRISLVCQEKASFQQGTNSRTEIRQVAQHEIFRGEDLVATPDEPLEIHRAFQVPAEAMHSFRAPRNEIAWMFVVDTLAERLPRFRRAFPLIVYPSPPELA